MGNAMTEHSKELRRQSARNWSNKMTAANRFEIKCKEEHKITAIREGLNSIEGDSYVSKILDLIEFYKANKK